MKSSFSNRAPLILNQGEKQRQEQIELKCNDQNLNRKYVHAGHFLR